jgi:hypothetical protein
MTPPPPPKTSAARFSGALLDAMPEQILPASDPMRLPRHERQRSANVSSRAVCTR